MTVPPFSCLTTYAAMNVEIDTYRRTKQLDQLDQLVQAPHSKHYRGGRIRIPAAQTALSPLRRLSGRLNGIRRRFLEIQEIDFFGSPLRTKLEHLLAHADEAETAKSGRTDKPKSGEYVNRVWMTRPRPGIDRVSSAWL